MCSSLLTSVLVISKLPCSNKPFTILICPTFLVIIRARCANSNVGFESESMSRLNVSIWLEFNQMQTKGGIIE